MSSSPQWISLQQARNESYGKVAWWRLPAPDGERIRITASEEEEEEERLVWKGITGTMYLGGWKSNKWHGLGVFYFPDGCVLAGYWNEGNMEGKAMHVLLPESPCWIENHWPRSLLLDPSTQTPLPFLYIGCYQNFFMNDSDAIVILQDGTTRRGPWKDNAPIGDWWQEHEDMETMIRWEQLSLLLSFDNNNNGDEEEEEEEKVTATAATSHNIPSPETGVPAVPECVPPTVHHHVSTVVVVSDTTSDYSSRCSIASTSYPSQDELEFQRSAETSIRHWLMQLLSPDANPHEMQYYASRFYQDGFHSVSYIQQYCSMRDIRSWMTKKAHVRVISHHLASEQRIHTIALWLSKIVLGSQLHAWEAHEYAVHLVDEGLLSIADIREFCTEQDVQDFSWMKPFHQRRLMAQLEQYRVR